MEINKKDILGFIMIIFNSILLFIVSNFYVLSKGYNIKIPIIVTVFAGIFLNVFPYYIFEFFPKIRFLNI